MAKHHSPRFLALVQDAKSRIRETTVDDIQARLAGGEKFLLVDVREESEYAKDHLPGAVHLGKGILERDAEEKIPDTATAQETAKLLVRRRALTPFQAERLLEGRYRGLVIDGYRIR